MKLTLKRPIVFFDLETTGTDIARDRVVQIAVLKVQPDGSEELKTRLINPGIPIPAVATAIHHITDEAVAGEPKFRDIAKNLAGFFQGADIAGFNSNRFDVPILVEEFGRCSIVFPEADAKLVDVQVIYHRKEERSLRRPTRPTAARTWRGRRRGRGRWATLEVFKKSSNGTTIGTTLEELHAYSNSDTIVDYARKLKRNENGEIVYAFGKNRGKPILDDPGYAEWMLGGDFPESTKNVLRKILAGATGAGDEG